MAILWQACKKLSLKSFSARAISTSFSFSASAAQSVRICPTGRSSVSLSTAMMSFRSSKSGTASVCARETKALAPSKTLILPSSTACARFRAFRRSESDACRSINALSMKRSIAETNRPEMAVEKSRSHSNSQAIRKLVLDASSRHRALARRM